jgi:hypothetical protein
MIIIRLPTGFDVVRKRDIFTTSVTVEEMMLFYLSLVVLTLVIRNIVDADVYAGKMIGSQTRCTTDRRDLLLFSVSSSISYLLHASKKLLLKILRNKKPLLTERSTAGRGTEIEHIL